MIEDTNGGDTLQVKYQRQNDEKPLTTKDLSQMEEADVEQQSPQHNHASSQEGLNGAGRANGSSGDNRRQKKGILGSSKLFKILLIAAIALVLLIIIGYLIYAFGISQYEEAGSASADEKSTAKNPSTVPNPEVAQGPSSSVLQKFANGAICSDSEVCSVIGRDVMQKGGNIVDAAIATLLCNGITTLQSLGIGGGFLMNLYVKAQKKAWTIDSREVAPLQATKDMFTNTSEYASVQGPLSIAVPGEIAGYAEALKHFGTMKWKELIQPSIEICKNGFQLTRHMHDSLLIRGSIIKNDTHLRNSFVNNATGEFHPVGTHVYPPKELCQTYQMLADDGPESFYHGKLGDLIAEDLKDMGSILIRDDLSVYHVDMVQSILVEIEKDSLMYVVPPVGSGVVVSHMINLLRGFNMSKDDIANNTRTALTYHRMIEAFKFAWAKRSSLGDLRFNADSTYLIANLTSNIYADEIRHLIHDNETFDDPEYYGAEYDVKSDKGTSHLSFVAPNGDAIAVTSTVNFYFGCGMTGKRTGIIFNSGMDDFAKPDRTTLGDLPPARTNFIEPRKRAMSSMSPTIITNEKGVVKLVVGAAGGSKITTAVAQVIARVLWLNQDIKQAIDSPRIHHQLIPNVVEYEYGVLQDVLDELEARGHKLKRYRNRGSVVCGIQKNETAVYGNADYRKEGSKPVVAGF